MPYPLDHILPSNSIGYAIWPIWAAIKKYVALERLLVVSKSESCVRIGPNKQKNAAFDVAPAGFDRYRVSHIAI